MKRKIGVGFLLALLIGFVYGCFKWKLLYFLVMYLGVTAFLVLVFAVLIFLFDEK